MMEFEQLNGDGPESLQGIERAFQLLARGWTRSPAWPV